MRKLIEVQIALRWRDLPAESRFIVLVLEAAPELTTVAQPALHS